MENGGSLLAPHIMDSRNRLNCELIFKWAVMDALSVINNLHKSETEKAEGARAT